ncbi:hypothetical protein [Tropicimonas sp. S265A]|uniref:hypothetical protein n=1 Tax=Tropicimonas sp. S265A TaxID=3415134 RepID=UPI003C7D5E00
MSVLSALAGAVPAPAQVPQAAAINAAQGLALFEDRCQIALFDPNAYIASVPPTLPVGGSAFAQSPDQQILSAHEFHNPWFVEFYISSTGTHRMLRCTAHGWSDGTHGGGLADPDALAQQLKAALAGRADGALVGGLMPQNFADVFNGQAVGVPSYQQHYYAGSFDWGGQDVPVWVEIHIGGLSLTTVRIEESAQ